MKLKSTDPEAGDYLVINLDTRNCILRVVSADDETGEYQVLNLSGEAVPLRDKETKLWRSSEELVYAKEWINDEPVLDISTKVGNIKLVKKDDTDGILKALGWFMYTQENSTLRWVESELDPTTEQAVSWETMTKTNEHNLLPTEGQKVD